MLATGGCSSRTPTSLRRSRWRRATRCSQSRWLTPVSAVPFPILSPTRSLKAGSLRRHTLLRRRRRLGPALAPAAGRVRRAVGGGGAALGAGAAADDRRAARAARRLRAHRRCAPSAPVPRSMRRLTSSPAAAQWSGRLCCAERASRWRGTDTWTATTCSPCGAAHAARGREHSAAFVPTLAKAVRLLYRASCFKRKKPNTCKKTAEK